MRKVVVQSDLTRSLCTVNILIFRLVSKDVRNVLAYQLLKRCKVAGKEGSSLCSTLSLLTAVLHLLGSVQCKRQGKSIQMNISGAIMP